MIETLAALLTFLGYLQTAYATTYPEWPSGRSWAFSVSASKVTDAMLEANVPACCVYVHADGKVFRVGSLVFLVKR